MKSTNPAPATKERGASTADGAIHTVDACERTEMSMETRKAINSRNTITDHQPCSSVKFCRNCGTPKVFGEFGKKDAAADGLQPWCRSCRTAYMREARSRGKWGYTGSHYKMTRINGKTVRAHRATMAKILGVGTLPRGVDVRFLNGNGKDVRPENLVLVPVKATGNLKNRHI